MLTAPDIPAVTSFVMWGGYDMQTGAYYLNMASNELPKQYEVTPPLSRSVFSPGSLASEGGR
jgi:hypothetical protein